MTKKSPEITTLFLDIGGVLLTNGWDHHARARAVRIYGLDLEETESRHHLTFDTYELGKLTLEQYLNRVVFYRERSFTRVDFREFMFAQSKRLPMMIELVKSLKIRHGLKIAVVSNEGRELTDFRIRDFGLGRFVDFFICSCFVHLRKPDEDIYRLALDVAQVPAENVIYVEDRPMFVQVAESLGIRGIHHQSAESTRDELVALGLTIDLGP
jgi:putative hydrolase of the HAD superfamily